MYVQSSKYSFEAVWLLGCVAVPRFNNNDICTGPWAGRHLYNMLHLRPAPAARPRPPCPGPRLSCASRGCCTEQISREHLTCVRRSYCCTRLAHIRIRMPYTALHMRRTKCGSRRLLAVAGCARRDFFRHFFEARKMCKMAKMP